MRRKLFVCLMAVWPLLMQAQTAWHFGYFSYGEMLRAIPEYGLAQKNMEDLRMKYDAEMKRAEDEFNKKYEEFLDGQRDFAPSIYQKRQAELQDMIEKNVMFRDKARQLIEQAESEAYTPIKERLNEAVAQLGRERGYAFILNTDNNACPYVDPEKGEDVTQALRNILKGDN